MLRIQWSRGGIADLSRLHGFLRGKSQRSADRAIVAIRSATSRLRDFPESGRLAEDTQVDHRELIVPFGTGGYVVTYTRRGEDVLEILDVRHQREAGYSPSALKPP